MGPIWEFLPTQRVFQYFFLNTKLFLHISSIPSIMFFPLLSEHVIHNVVHIFQLRCVVFVKKFCSGHAGDQAFHPTAREGASQTTGRVSAVTNRPLDVECLWLTFLSIYNSF